MLYALRTDGSFFTNPTMRKRADITDAGPRFKAWTIETQGMAAADASCIDTRARSGRSLPDVEPTRTGETTQVPQHVPPS